MLFGVTDSRRYPIYVQSHAIRNLHERVPIGNPGLVHDAMWQSFLSPKVIQNHQGEYLIEYRFFDYKLGYFTVEVVEESILATTFLFLTMQGTPEARLLFERLRLRRPDITLNELDLLHTYIFTDIQKDKDLVSAFEACGCGHLLKMARPEFEDSWVSGYARDLREYLGMDLL
jgi:hypothetical protein